MGIWEEKDVAEIQSICQVNLHVVLSLMNIRTTNPQENTKTFELNEIEMKVHSL